MNASPNMKSQIRFFVRVILPGIFTFILFIALILGYLIPGFESAMMQRKQETIRELTRTAWSILEHYHRLETTGAITRAEACSQSSNAVKELRYGDESKDYFWITDRHPVMVMHPYRPDLDGKDLTDFRDPEGKALFVEFVRATEATGEGFVDYRWQWKDDSLRIVPKLSYVRVFEPWDWIIGTGIYVEDVRLEIRRMENRAILISGGIGLLIVLLLILITRQSHRIDVSRRKAEQEVIEAGERYKALAEAASEGVLIWSGQGIHANRTLLSWLGFQDADLIGAHLEKVLPDAGFDRFRTADDLYDELTARMYLECALRGKDESLKAVHADFSRIQIAGGQAVMMVARPLQVAHELATMPFSDELLDQAGTGLFRTTASKKGRLIKVNSQLMHWFGLIDTDPGQHTLDAYFGDIRDYRLVVSILGEKGSVSDFPVRIRRTDGRMIWVILNALAMDNALGDKWYEGSMDLLSLADAGEVLPTAELTDLSLAVRASSGKIPDIRTFEELEDAWNGLPDNILKRIAGAGSADELKSEYRISTRLAGSLIDGQADPWLIVRFISGVADAICKRVVELLLEQMDPPPAEFAVIQLGSAGRGEQTLATDQDNAIVFADPPGDNQAEVQAYFLALGSAMNTWLDQIGYERCKGDVMAGNPRWCQPLSVWKDYFAGWIRNPGPEELLEISIFFDFAYVAGQPALIENLREFISRGLRTSEIYFHHMAAAWMPFAPHRQQAGKSGVNLKKLQMPLTGMIRLYALRHGREETGALEKCIGLFTCGEFTREMLAGITEAWKTLMRLRLEGQHRLIAEGRQADNQLDPALMNPMMEYHLEQATELIDNLMLKATVDFHLGPEG